MDINQKITEELGVKRWQVDAAVKLIDEGNTIPFIARYRKEAHGTLDDEQLRKLHERLMYQVSLNNNKLNDTSFAKNIQCSRKNVLIKNIAEI